MRPGARYLLTFFAGSVVGGALAAGFVGWHWNRNFKNWYVTGLAGQAFTAREIYAGRGQQVADRIRGALPAYVLAVERQPSKAEGRDWAYWLVSDVYKVSGTAAPAAIMPVLAKPPPRPSCKRPPAEANYHGVP